MIQIPIIRDHLITLASKLINKAEIKNIDFIKEPDTELICLTLEALKYGYYKEKEPRIEILTEILFNIMTTLKTDQ